MQLSAILKATVLLAATGAVHHAALAHPGSGIAVDAQGRVFFTAGPMIVMLEPGGPARTIVRDRKGEKFYQLHHIQRAPDGGLVTASDRGDAIWRFTPEGKLTRFYPPPDDDRALRIGLGGDPFALDREGNLYAVNSKQNRFTQILKITPEGQISVLAGGDWGFADGRGAEAKFGNLHSGSMLVLANGTLLVTDDSKRIRRVAADGTVTTPAGGRESGYLDGPGKSARFSGAHGLAVDERGDVLVAEYAGPGSLGGRIRKIAADGLVTTFAGSGLSRSIDGPLLEASFAGPTGIAIAPNGEIFVLEPDGPRVRKISSGRVTTIHRGLP